MKRVNLLFLLLASSCFVFSQKTFPDYWTVVNKFFSLYHHERTNEEMIAFALKKDGWHILTVNPVQEERTVTDQLFWSAQKGRFQVLENFLRATEEPVNEKALAYINSSSYLPYGFARCPYFGYNGWDADIIKDFDNSSAASDTLLEALARAHSAYASRYLWYQYGGYNLTGDTLQRKLGRMELPGDERVKLFAQHITKASELYQKICDRNKNYETFVGSVGRKCFNENYHGYIQLMMCRRPAEAAKFLAKCRLLPEDSIAAQNLLHSVGENGILFTYGDNDTYTVSYLQKKHNIRKDVAVLNTSLLGLAVYLDYLKNSNYVQFATPASEYGRKDFDYSIFYSENGSGKTIRLDHFLANYKNLRRVPVYGTDSIRVHDAGHLFMPFDRPADALKPDTLQIPLRSYIAMNEYMMYDIVASNFQNRPIYFSDYFQEFPVNNLEISGILLQLTRQSTSYMGIGAPIAAAQELYIKTKYKTPFNQDSHHSYLNTYWVNKQVDLFVPLIKFRIRSGDRQAATDLVKQCIAPFGDNPPYIDRIDSLAPLLYENGFEIMGDKIVSNYVKAIMLFRAQKIYSEFFDDKRIIERLEQLGEMLKKYKRDIGPVAAAILAVTPH